MMPELRTVYVVADLGDDGALRPLTAEMVTAGRQLADAWSGELVVLVLSADGDAARDVAAFAGVDGVISAVSAALLPYTSGAWASAALAVIAGRHPAAVLFPGSIAGRDYAPRVAARMGAPLAADVSAISVPNGKLIVHRPVLGGRVQTAVEFVPDALPMMTIRPGSFPRAERSGSAAPIEIVQIDDAMLDRRVQVIETRDHTPIGKSLTEAKRIVSGGRGLQGPDAFAMLEELAAIMDAAVGASGAAVGAGWRSHDDQIGSTGHSVAPSLYLAVGISGAPQHLVGMQGSEYIVAINRDPDAPIFDVASFGIIGDLFQVVPALIEELGRTPE